MQKLVVWGGKGVSAHGNWSNNELPLDLLDVNRMEIKDEIPSSG